MFSASGLEWLHRWRVTSSQGQNIMFGHHTIGSTLRAALVGALAVGGLAATQAQAGTDVRFATTGYVLAVDDDGRDVDDRDTLSRRDDDAGADPANEQDGLVRDAQWGPPHGNAWGHRRGRGWDDNGWGRGRHGWDRGRGWDHGRGWGPPHHRWASRCRTVWERRYDPWRGWTSHPVRRCW
jgi:hypothetical protein